jgi:oxygen-dependent protoporphyrinogen oxidase
VPASGPPTVVVVGAGISGLAAAWELVTRRADLRVLVLEGAAGTGGKLALVEVGGHTVDAGGEALLARRPEAVELAQAVGLGDDLETPRTTSAGLWTRGRLAPMPAGTLMGIPAHGADAAGILTAEEAAAVDAEPSRAPSPLAEDVDVASYVAGRVGPAVVERLVEPLLGGVYAGHASRLSLQATLPAAWEAARQGQSLVAAARTLAGRARSAGPVGPVFTGIRGGVGRLPQAVTTALAGRGVEVRTGVRVRALRRTGRPDVHWQLVTGSRADEQVVEADAVVLAVPASAAARLLAEVAGRASARLAEIDTASMALVTAVIPGGAARLASTPSGERSGFLVPPVEGRLVKAVTYSSVKWPWLGALAGDDLVVRLSVGRQGEEAALQRSDEELTALALAELDQALGTPLPAPVDSRVVRWGGALPQYAVGHLDRVADVRADVAGVSGLAVCGAYLDGVGVPACIGSGRRAAAEVLADLARAADATGRTMA